LRLLISKVSILSISIVKADSIFQQPENLPGDGDINNIILCGRSYTCADSRWLLISIATPFLEGMAVRSTTIFLNRQVLPKNLRESCLS